MTIDKIPDTTMQVWEPEPETKRPIIVRRWLLATLIVVLLTLLYVLQPPACRHADPDNTPRYCVD